MPCTDRQIELGRKTPTAFLSTRTHHQQAKWSAMKREMFAIMWALGCLDSWCFGARARVITDHNPSTCLTRPTSSRPESPGGAWPCKGMSEFSDVKGTLNKGVDTLSRLERQ